MKEPDDSRLPIIDVNSIEILMGELSDLCTGKPHTLSSKHVHITSPI